MQPGLDNISSNMTEKEPNRVLNDYADLLQSILQVIPFAENEMIDNNQISTFPGDSGINGCSEYKNFVYILHSVKENLFAPLYLVHTNGESQTLFPDKNVRIISHIYEFLQEWNTKSKYTK